MLSNLCVLDTLLCRLVLGCLGSVQSRIHDIIDAWTSSNTSYSGLHHKSLWFQFHRLSIFRCWYHELTLLVRNPFLILRLWRRKDLIHSWLRIAVLERSGREARIDMSIIVLLWEHYLSSWMRWGARFLSHLLQSRVVLLTSFRWNHGTWLCHWCVVV